MNAKIALGIFTFAAMFAGTATAEVLPDGQYTFSNLKGDGGDGWIFRVTLEKVKEVKGAGGVTNGIYYVHTNVGWLSSKSNDGAVINENGASKDTLWQLHKNSNGWNFIHADNGANALSIVGLKPKGGGVPTGEFKLRRNNAGGNGNSDQLFDLKKGH